MMFTDEEVFNLLDDRARHFVLGDEAWDEFLALLDEPLTDTQEEALRELLTQQTVFSDPND